MVVGLEDDLWRPQEGINLLIYDRPERAWNLSIYDSPKRA